MNMSSMSWKIFHIRYANLGGNLAMMSHHIKTSIRKKCHHRLACRKPFNIFGHMDQTWVLRFTILKLLGLKL